MSDHLMVKVGGGPPTRLCDLARSEEIAQSLIDKGFAFSPEQSKQIEYGDFCDDCAVLILTTQPGTRVIGWENPAEAKLAILAHLVKGLEAGGDDPLNTITTQLSLVETLTVVLGLNAIIDDDEIPGVIQRKCLVLVERLTKDIEEQKGTD